jgi:dephospho-CoA kinase
MKIALSGKMFSGKSVIAEYLRTKYGFIEIAFADKLKDIAEDLFGMDTRHKDRELLQVLGMKMREIDSLVWVKYIIDIIPHFVEAGYSVVVSDVRLLNEFDSLKKIGFTMVRCEIDPAIQQQRLMKERPEMPLVLRKHISEIMLDNIEQLNRSWDYIVHNNKDVEELLKKTDTIVEILRRAEHD